MKALIKIEDLGGINAVDSRKIHAFLGVKENHRDWIKRKVARIGA